MCMSRTCYTETPDNRIVSITLRLWHAGAKDRAALAPDAAPPHRSMPFRAAAQSGAAELTGNIWAVGKNESSH